MTPASAVPAPSTVVKALPTGLIDPGWLPPIPSGGFAQNIGDGASTVFLVTHSLGTRDVHIDVYDNATFDAVGFQSQRTTANAVTISTAFAPSLNAYRVLITPN